MSKADEVIASESLNAPQIGPNLYGEEYETKYKEFLEKIKYQDKKIEDDFEGISIGCGYYIFNDGSHCKTGAGSNVGRIYVDPEFPLSGTDIINLYNYLRIII